MPAGSGAYAAAPKLRSIPPLDPTAPRTKPRIPIPRALLPTPRPRPILASEGLLDDAAPIEPYGRGSRILDVVLGAVMVACGVLIHLAQPKPSSIAMYGAGAAVALFAFVRHYGIRAMLVLLAATAGWLPSFVESPTLSFFGRSIAPVVLATALFLRATYRGDRFVRAMLALGIAGFALCALGVGGAWVWLDGVPLGARLVAGAMGAASLLAMLGFMNEQTTGGAVAWGVIVLLVSALGPFASLGDGVALSRLMIAGVVGNACGLAIATLALFQLGALFVAPRARVRASSRSSLPAAEPEEEEVAPPEDG